MWPGGNWRSEVEPAPASPQLHDQVVIGQSGSLVDWSVTEKLSRFFLPEFGLRLNWDVGSVKQAGVGDGVAPPLGLASEPA